MTLVGRGNDPDASPVTSLASTVTPGQQAILTVTAPHVTIRNFYFSTNFNYVRQAIRAEPGADGLVVEDVRIRAVGAPALTNYGQANAIWINPDEGAPFSATVRDSFIEGTFAPTFAFFRAGIDARHAGLPATGNTIIAINHDISLRRQPAAATVLIEENAFLGYGVYMASPMSGAGATNITNNLFDPAVDPESPATAGDFSAMRLISNPNGHPVTISDNQFTWHERGILIENFPGVTLSGNSFDPLATSSRFQHVVLSNKELFSGAAPAPLPLALALTATGNEFNASAVPGTGTALMLLNDNAQGEPTGGYYGSIVLGNNDFDSGLRWNVELGSFDCVNSNDQTGCPRLGDLYTNVNATMAGTRPSG